MHVLGCFDPIESLYLVIAAEGLAFAIIYHRTCQRIQRPLAMDHRESESYVFFLHRDPLSGLKLILVSAISSTRTLVASIMALGIRMYFTSTFQAWINFCAQDEAHTNTDVSLLGHELWAVQEDGDFRECMSAHLLQPNVRPLSAPNPQRNAK